MVITQQWNICPVWGEGHPLPWACAEVSTVAPVTAQLASRIKFSTLGTSLVAQCLRTLLPMQGTWVWALVQEDPTCHRATGPVSHNCWACALGPQAAAAEPTCHDCRGPRAWSPCSAMGEATAMRGLRTAAKGSPRSPQLEKARAQQQRPNAAKNK